MVEKGPTNSGKTLPPILGNARKKTFLREVFLMAEKYKIKIGKNFWWEDEVVRKGGRRGKRRSNVVVCSNDG